MHKLLKFFHHAVAKHEYAQDTARFFEALPHISQQAMFIVWRDVDTARTSFSRNGRIASSQVCFFIPGGGHLTPQQIQLVQQSFARIISTPEAFGQSFYTHLFEVDPGLRPLFKGDMQSQSRKLMEMLGAVIGRLNQLEPIISAIQALGARHVSYGVQAVHYESVGSALLWALEKELGAAFTPEVRNAWTAAYEPLAETMKAPACGQPH